MNRNSNRTAGYGFRLLVVLIFGVTLWITFVQAGWDWVGPTGYSSNEHASPSQVNPRDLPVERVRPSPLYDSIVSSVTSERRKTATPASIGSPLLASAEDQDANRRRVSREESRASRVLNQLPPSASGAFAEQFRAGIGSGKASAGAERQGRSDDALLGTKFVQEAEEADRRGRSPSFTRKVSPNASRIAGTAGNTANTSLQRQAQHPSDIEVLTDVEVVGFQLSVQGGPTPGPTDRQAINPVPTAVDSPQETTEPDQCPPTTTPNSDDCPPTTNPQDSESCPSTSDPNDTIGCPATSNPNDPEGCPPTSNPNDTETCPPTSNPNDPEGCPPTSNPNDPEGCPPTSNPNDPETCPPTSNPNDPEGCPPTSNPNDPEGCPETSDPTDPEGCPETSNPNNGDCDPPSTFYACDPPTTHPDPAACPPTEGPSSCPPPDETFSPEQCPETTSQQSCTWPATSYPDPLICPPSAPCTGVEIRDRGTWWYPARDNFCIGSTTPGPLVGFDAMVMGGAGSFSWTVTQGQSKISPLQVYSPSNNANHSRVEFYPLQPSQAVNDVTIQVTFTTQGGSVCTDSHSFTIVNAKLKSFSLTGTKFHAVGKDADGTTFTTPHYVDAAMDGWGTPAKNAGDTNNPVSFEVSSTVTVTNVVIHATPQAFFTSHNASLWGFTYHMINGKWEFTKYEASSPSTIGGDLTFASATADHPLARLERRFYHIGFALKWDVPPGTGPNLFDYVGCDCYSRNRLYVTAKAPIFTPLYQTILDVGCRSAQDMQGQPDPDLVNAIYGDFTDLAVRKADYDPDDPNAGLQMGYWLSGTPVQRLQFLMQPTTVDGSCFAWAGLFTAACRAQGISNLTVREVRSTYETTEWFSGDASFMVNNWLLGGPIVSGHPPFVYYLSGCTDQIGVPSHMNADPPGAWVNHAIVLFNPLGRTAVWYDPSYGSASVADLQAYENAATVGAIKGFLVGGSPQNLVAPNNATLLELKDRLLPDARWK